MTTPPEVVEGLWQALDQYLASHPEALADIGEFPLFRPEEPAISAVERDTLWNTLRRQLDDAPEVDTAVRIGRTAAKIEAWIGESCDHVHEFVLALSEWITDLNATAKLRPSQAVSLRRAVLQSSFPVLELCLRRQIEPAARYLVDEWQTVAAGLGLAVNGSESEERVFRSSSSSDETSGPVRLPRRRLLWSFQAAVFQLLRAEETARESLDALIDLRTALDLDAGQAGRLLGVSESTVQEWEKGQATIPSETVATLSEVQDSLQRLRSMFLPERLPQVVRRPAEIFDGDSALDWILEGRIREVTDRYDFLLRYQA